MRSLTLTREEAAAYMRERAEEAEHGNLHGLVRPLEEVADAIENIEVPVTILSVVDLDAWFGEGVVKIEVTE